MITEEKIAITIRDIMQDFERAFDDRRQDLTNVWKFEVPSIREIKHKDYDLYDRIWTTCFDQWLIVDLMGQFKDEIQELTANHIVSVNK